MSDTPREGISRRRMLRTGATAGGVVSVIAIGDGQIVYLGDNLRTAKGTRAAPTRAATFPATGTRTPR